MINSRKIEDLHPKVADMCHELLSKCKNAGIDLLVTSTYRDKESQSALYAQGRTIPGKIVTKAKPGQSWHNWRLAFDVVPLRNGKPVWGISGADKDLWEKIGKIGEDVGLEWAGRWVKFREFPHFQYTGGQSISQIAEKGGFA